MVMRLLIINTGGTFNKIYQKVQGDLIVPNSNVAIEQIVKSFSNEIEFNIIGKVFKDSLDMKEEDREIIYKSILKEDAKHIIIIHGTDTIDLTANYLAERIKDRKIILTGAMVPISIQPMDGTLNFGVALGFLQSNIKNGVYISMSGIVTEYNQIYKDREVGVFKKIKSDD